MQRFPSDIYSIPVLFTDSFIMQEKFTQVVSVNNSISGLYFFLFLLWGNICSQGTKDEYLILILYSWILISRKIINYLLLWLISLLCFLWVCKRNFVWVLMGICTDPWYTRILFVWLATSLDIMHSGRNELQNVSAVNHNSCKLLLVLV